jgi:hypothetical protein
MSPGDPNAEFSIKLQSANCELNICVSREELQELRDVANARWLSRKSLRVGRCLTSPVFWSVQDSQLSVLVGLDDESWEAGVTFPEDVLRQLLEEIELVS